MKKNILVVILFFIVATATAQEKYTVSTVRGNILKIDSSKVVPGTVLTLSDKLIFPAKGGMVILMHPDKGTLTMRPVAKNPEASSIVIVLMKYLEINKERWVNKSAQ